MSAGRHRRPRTLAADVEQLRRALVELWQLLAGDDRRAERKGTAYRPDPE